MAGSWLAILGVTAYAPSAAGQEGEPTPQYTVDGSQGPVTGSTRVIGLGGAYVAIAENTDGVAHNPASVAVRMPYSWHRWDYGFGLDFAVGAWLPETDFLNREGASEQEEEVEQRSILFGSVATLVQYRHAGAGVAAEGRQQALRRSADTMAGLAPTDLSANFGILHGSVAYGFIDGALVVGAGPRVTGVSLSRPSEASNVLSVGGVGYQGGIVYKPTNLQFRVGAAYKSVVEPSLDPEAAGEAGPFETTAIRLPWQASFGIAYQVGPRALNPPFVSTEQRLAARGLEADDAEEVEAELRREYFTRPRFYVLVTTELLVLGQSSDGIGYSSVWHQTADVEPSGREVTFSPRLGVETEAVPNRLRLRAGTYLEPARVRGASDRLHGTFGLDVKLFTWDAFGLIGDFDSWLASLAVDGARQYLNTSFSIGFWH